MVGQIKYSSEIKPRGKTMSFQKLSFTTYIQALSQFLEKNTKIKISKIECKKKLRLEIDENRRNLLKIEIFLKNP